MVHFMYTVRMKILRVRQMVLSLPVHELFTLDQEAEVYIVVPCCWHIFFLFLRLHLWEDPQCVTIDQSSEFCYCLAFVRLCFGSLHGAPGVGEPLLASDPAVSAYCVHLW
jgi:hypothetical protein